MEVKNGIRRAAKNTLSKRFHNWFYAGWIVSPKAGISPKLIRGHWKPVVSTEEFEHGLQILAVRAEDRPRKRRHKYLLSGLIYYQRPTTGKRIRMSCSTSNPNRNGGISYYRIVDTDIRFLCKRIDAQLTEWLQCLQIQPGYIPAMRAAYTDEVAMKMGHWQPNRRQEIEHASKAVDDEDARVVRLFASGKISESVMILILKNKYESKIPEFSLYYYSSRVKTHINGYHSSSSLIGFLTQLIMPWMTWARFRPHQCAHHFLSCHLS